MQLLSTEQDNKITNKVYYYIGCSCTLQVLQMHNKAVCQISANLTNLFCQISNYLSYFWQTVRFCFYENPSVRSKEQFICVMKQQRDRNSNCQTGHCWTRWVCSTSNFLTHKASKKDDFELSKLEEPLTRGA